jgi:preprotein translocase subunit YajC
MLISTAYADNDTITIQNSETMPESPSAIETGWMTNLIPMVLIFCVFYFLLIRPQEKRRREQENLVNGVKKGEEVLTNSGIFGVVTKINDSDNIIHIQVAKDLEIKILKNSIADIVSRSKKAVVDKTKQDTKNKK